MNHWNGDAPPALDVRAVSKTFSIGWSAAMRSAVRRKPAGSRRRAVDAVTFTVDPGEIFGVIGANGSGKSTLIRMISTLLLPDEGSLAVYGYDAVTDAPTVRRLLNRVSADPSFFRNMSAYENLQFFGRAYGLGSEAIAAGVGELLDALRLPRDLAREPMEHLSRGQQQKVAVARAFLTSPRLLLLDEPTTGLDPRSKRDVQGFVTTARERDGVTVLVTTHDMAEAEALCDRIAFIAGGRIVAIGTPLELRITVARDRSLDDVDMDDVFMELTGRSIDDDEDEDEEGDRVAS